jgi:hypothetical protein
MPGDVLCENVELPTPRPGDVIVLHNAGAYGFTMSMLGWGSFKPPREVLCDAGACELVDCEQMPCGHGRNGPSHMAGHDIPTVMADHPSHE